MEQKVLEGILQNAPFPYVNMVFVGDRLCEAYHCKVWFLMYFVLYCAFYKTLQKSLQIQKNYKVQKIQKTIVRVV